MRENKYQSVEMTRTNVLYIVVSLPSYCRPKSMAERWLGARQKVAA